MFKETLTQRSGYLSQMKKFVRTVKLQQQGLAIKAFHREMFF